MIPKSGLAVAILTASMAFGAEEPAHTRAVYASPLAMIIYSGMADNPVISAAYEQLLTRTGYSLFVPVHVGYREDETEWRYTLGAGLGLRKYFFSPFSGSYLTAQSDFLRYRNYTYEYTPAYQDADGNWIGGGSTVPKEDFLSVTQLSYGYKWAWRQFTLDLSLGGAFYAKADEKFTSVIGGVNIGFPFSVKSFGIRCEER